MTTQWNPAHAGDTGPGETGPGDSRASAEGGERESGPATSGPWNDESSTGPWNDEPAGPGDTSARDASPYQSSPWRGYTMPVPEHPEHAEERERAAEDPPAYDGITGYPDPSGAGSVQGVDPRGPEGREGGSAQSDPGSGSPQSAWAQQPRSGRHARPSAPARGERHGSGGERREPGSGDHDDPDGLAGWVDSLTSAADDTRIAGRNTGTFPVISPDTERPGELPSDQHSDGSADLSGERGRPQRRPRGALDGHQARTTTEGVPGAEPDEPVEDTWTERAWLESARVERERAQRERSGGTAAQEAIAGAAYARTDRTEPRAPEDDEQQEHHESGTGHSEPDTGPAEHGGHGGHGGPGGPTEHGDSGTAQLAGDPHAAQAAGAEQREGAPEPLPRRIPGPSAVSGAFRAIGGDTAAPGPEGRTRDEGAGENSPGPEGAAEEGPDGRGTHAVEAEEEYRPTTHDHWQPTSTTSRAELIERLDALSTLTELGQDDLPAEVLGRAGQLLDHAGARLRLSGEHTVVALAGGTGSGKSSLFNALCGLELSQTGVTRPTTSKAHACVWGHEGADALLSWLGVPTRYRHSRTSVLDSGASELTGLVLLDLPDHDSVRSMHTAEADRLIGSVDLLVWVLDPQKYADAAVHHRYLAKMAGHGAVTVAVLNQVDKVESDELEELLTDLRRLLESESGVHPRVITTSTLTGQGISDLREFLGETVTDRRALVDRLVADLDQVVEPFEEFYGEEFPATVSAQVRSRVQEGLAGAAGVTAVSDVVETNDVRRGKRQVGWPVVRRVAKLRKDPLAAVQLDFLRRDEPGVGGPVDAGEAELETVLGGVADEASEGMPGPWRRRMRAAARSGVAELPAELGEAVSGAVGDPDRSPSWWRLARTVQYALLAVAGVGLAWALLALVSWIGGGFTGLRVFDDPVFIVYSGAVVLAGLVVGWLIGVGCGNLVEVAAVQRREDVERAAQGRVREIAGLRVVAPMEKELERYRAFRAAYEVARVQR